MSEEKNELMSPAKFRNKKRVLEDRLKPNMSSFEQRRVLRAIRDLEAEYKSSKVRANANPEELEK